MMGLHRPTLRKPRLLEASSLLALPLLYLAICCLPAERAPTGFVSPLGLRPQQLRFAGRVRRRAEAAPVDADDEDDDFEDEEEEMEMEPEPEPVLADGQNYPEEAYKEYTGVKSPPQSWYDRRKIDRHKVNMMFFDMYAKPKSFFPHKLQPGDTVRVYYLEAVMEGDWTTWKWHSSRTVQVQNMKETFFDGVIMNFVGPYHLRAMVLRAMVGIGTKVMGMEMTIPMHSPLVQRIEVLRRGFIGRNKNAYFIRGLVGKKNQIPLDKERTNMDAEFKALRDARRDDEIPESEYPQQEHDRYPLPVWKQDNDDWEESRYNPDDFDKRTEYEKWFIGRYRKRAKGPDGIPPKDLRKLKDDGKPKSKRELDRMR